MISSWLWLLVPVAPLIMALMIVMLRQSASADRVIALTWISSIPALLAVIFVPENLLLPAFWPAAQLGVSADALSGIMAETSSATLLRGWLLFTTMLWALAAIYAADMLRTDVLRRRFFLFWLMSYSGNLLLVIGQDTLSFYVGFSVMSLSAYGLVVHDGTALARRAGRLYLQLAITGEVLLLAGIIMLADQLGGITTFVYLEGITANPLTVLLLLGGLGLKAGFWPLHVWLPQAHPVAPAPASAVLSGAMIKAGILGLWRFLPGQSVESSLLQSWALPLMALGIFSALYAVKVGLVQKNAKQVLAYSSVSQMGYMLMIVALAWYSPLPLGSLWLLLLVYAMHHAACKGALFLAADIVKSPPPAAIWLQKLMPVLIYVPALALAALPLSSGAVAKVLLKEGMEGMDLQQWTVWLTIGALASTLLVLRATWLLEKDRGKTLAEPVGEVASLPWQKLLPWGLLSLLPLVLPWLWGEMRTTLIYSLGPEKLMELLGPLAIGLAIFLLALHHQWQLPAFLHKLPKPHLLWSLTLKRFLQRPPALRVRKELPRQRWRGYERQWNRFWHDNTVSHSSALLLLFLFGAALFLLLIS